MVEWDERIMGNPVVHKIVFRVQVALSLPIKIAKVLTMVHNGQTEVNFRCEMSAVIR